VILLVVRGLPVILDALPSLRAQPKKPEAKT
jgi:hypothetical protein